MAGIDARARARRAGAAGRPERRATTAGAARRAGEAPGWARGRAADRAAARARASGWWRSGGGSRQLARERGEGDRAWGFLQSALQAAPGEPLVVRELSRAGRGARTLGRAGRPLRRARRGGAADAQDCAAARARRGVASRGQGRRGRRRRERRWRAMSRATSACSSRASERRWRRATGSGWRRCVRRGRAGQPDGTPTGKPDSTLGGDGADLRRRRCWPSTSGATPRRTRRSGRADAGAALRARRWTRWSASTRAPASTPIRGAARERAGAFAVAGAGERLWSRSSAMREALDDRRARRRRRGVGASCVPTTCGARAPARARSRGAEAARGEPTICRAGAAAARGAPRRQLLERADLLEHRLDDPVGAAAAYREVLALRPGDPRAAQAFEPLSRRRAKYSGPHEALAAGVGRSGGGAAARGAVVAQPRARRQRCSSSATSTSASATSSATRRRPIAICSTRAGAAGALRGLAARLARFGDGPTRAERWSRRSRC